MSSPFEKIALPRLEYAERGPCRGHDYDRSTVEPPRNRYEDGTAICTTCKQRIGIVHGGHHLKMHESHITWARKRFPPPKAHRA